MDRLKVAWNKEEEVENVRIYGIDFKLAREVVLNSSSLKLPNLEKDFVFIGPGRHFQKKRTHTLIFWPKEI